MFVHEVYTGSSFAGILHYREVLTESGLFVPTEIAQSVAYIDGGRWLSDRTLPGLILPDREEGPPETFSDRVECHSTTDLVAKGVEAWRKALRSIGNCAIKVEVRFNEIDDLQRNEVRTESGLIVPSGATNIENTFAGYKARPEEMEAIERMISDVNLHLATTSISEEEQQFPGNYL